MSIAFLLGLMYDFSEPFIIVADGDPSKLPYISRNEEIRKCLRKHSH